MRTEEFQHLVEVIEEVVESGSIDHPKLKAVEKIINQHFEENESEETRVMIFVEYRESVELITNLLKNYEPRVKPSQFIGQASGKTKGYVSSIDLPNTLTNRYLVCLNESNRKYCRNSRQVISTRWWLRALVKKVSISVKSI